MPARNTSPRGRTQAVANLAEAPTPAWRAAAMRIGGIDEAGRGPVIGPLVMAGVAVADPSLPAALGCTDSKRLAPDRRRALDRELRKAAGVRIEVRVVEAEDLDRQRRMGRSLTTIEVEGFQSIAAALGAPHVFVDAAHTSEATFADLLRPALPATIALVSEHKADTTYPVVGAASIIAKVARDAAVAALARRLERHVNLPLGSGYSHDAQTRAFLNAWWREFKAFPDGTRTTWLTAKEIAAPQPTTLDQFEVTAQPAQQPGPAPPPLQRLPA